MKERLFGVMKSYRSIWCGDCPQAMRPPIANKNIVMQNKNYHDIILNEKSLYRCFVLRKINIFADKNIFRKQELIAKSSQKILGID